MMDYLGVYCPTKRLVVYLQLRAYYMTEMNGMDRRVDAISPDLDDEAWVIQRPLLLSLQTNACPASFTCINCSPWSLEGNGYSPSETVLSCSSPEVAKNASQPRT
ncbi:hypothetical protein I7I53_03550 [Histoplasma capsulatum var. duboisii H88]|uniref:Uncharacterized protein n=1 Tax=Ajellomyces capsulatus (strain H88) TaxID=544711 RepID=A0A8A1LP94_AJEC8|nr:hypothetical protein I7I53_03550 [Histoplasma capsulatum var. duboisii H88]